MRLWHYKLIPFLPKSQLLAQWRELNSIFVKQDRHILINYIYDYPKSHLLNYSCIVDIEMMKRGYKIKSYDNFGKYLADAQCTDADPFPNHHDDEYLVICYFNLLEKYQRGQKDFSGEEMDALCRFCKPFIKRYMEEERWN